MSSSTLEDLFNHYIISSQISAWYTLSKCFYLLRIQQDDGNNKIRPLTISKFKFYWRHIKYTNNPNKWKATKKKSQKRTGEAELGRAGLPGLESKGSCVEFQFERSKGKKDPKRETWSKGKSWKQKSQRYKEWGKKKDIKGRKVEDTTERSILPSQKLPGDN